MRNSIKTKDLQAGMRVTEHVLGKKGDIKVNKGEILSKMHVDKMQRWHGLDEANPRGIFVENAPLHTGQIMPSVVDNPEKSPLIQKTATTRKKYAQGMDVDEDGNILEDGKPVNANKPKRGRPQKVRT